MPRPRASDVLKLQRVLRRVFHRQARDAAFRLSQVDWEAGQEVDLTHWVQATADSVKPILLPLWQEGMKRSRARHGQETTYHGMRRVIIPADVFAGRIGKERPVSIGKGVTYDAAREAQDQQLHRIKRLSSQVVKASRKKPVMEVDWGRDLFNPRVLDAVDEAVLKFCRATNRTAVEDLRTAIRKLREALRKGLKRGDAVQVLAKKIRKIFADPQRAYRIAVTETSRAVHGGALLAAKEDPDVGGKQWLASPNACERCMELDGKEVGLDEPFYVDPKGGPYAVTDTPPLHPYCFCDMTEVL